MNTSFSFKVIMSLFLGLEASEEKIDGRPVHEVILECNNLAANLSVDPLVLVFG
jgi:hypothetical protein